MVYWELMKKSYQLQLQYRMAHFVNNLGSMVFGFIFIAIWTGVLAGKEDPLSLYNIQNMTYYVAMSQCLLWVVGFTTPGLGIQNNVRTGSISIEMGRPTSYYLVTVSQEIGKIVYNSMFRSLPIGIVFVVTVGFYFPVYWETYIWALLSILLAMLIGINVSYLIGISACWTIEISWAHITYITLLFGLGGQFVPVDLLPGFLAELTRYLPFASVLYFPIMIYLEKMPVTPILIQLAWVIFFTFLNLWLTRQARRKLEIQGG